LRLERKVIRRFGPKQPDESPTEQGPV
jgi:hypothetical protein